MITISLAKLGRSIPAEVRASYGVYAITNRVNGRAYIGFTGQSFLARWRQHRAELRAGSVLRGDFTDDYQLLGEAAFDCEVLEVLESRAALRQREFYHIDAWLKGHENKEHLLYNGLRHFKSRREMLAQYPSLFDVGASKAGTPFDIVAEIVRRETWQAAADMVRRWDGSTDELARQMEQMA